MEKASEPETEIIFVRLVDDGTEVFRPALARRVNDDTFKILDFPGLDDDDEIPEFDVGDLVTCIPAVSETGNFLRAIELEVSQS